ncbi:hypothetical protein [Rivularia sp. UHCC 0363]
MQSEQNRNVPPYLSLKTGFAVPINRANRNHRRT